MIIEETDQPVEVEETSVLTPSDPLGPSIATISRLVGLCSTIVDFNDTDGLKQMAAQIPPFVPGWKVSKIYVDVASNTPLFLLVGDSTSVLASSLGVTTDLSPYLEPGGYLQHSIMEISSDFSEEEV